MSSTLVTSVVLSTSLVTSVVLSATLVSSVVLSASLVSSEVSCRFAVSQKTRDKVETMVNDNHNRLLDLQEQRDLYRHCTEKVMNRLKLHSFSVKFHLTRFECSFISLVLSVVSFHSF